MSQDYAYDARRTPPAPVLPVRLGAPGVEPTVFLVALVDTGADLSVVPEQVPAQAQLPRVGEITIRGVGGSQRRVPLFAAAVEAAGTTRIVEVVGLGGEALVGRDLLNRWTLRLDGPRQLMRVIPSA
ncbi:MAG: hypothetical protein XU14_C0018G0038 [Armatimonadetes bacterium CSP1-3]|nr:MAG: hypothetical protein XU14_C0018G0038 [Armatimonadetes bacterium CSP1-3]